MDSMADLSSAVKKGLLAGVRPEQVKAKNIDLYKPTLTVEDLWGTENTPTGGNLLDLVLAFYQDEIRDVPFYYEDENGCKARTMIRSPLSREIQDSTVESYKQRILRESISQVAAGVYWGHDRHGEKLSRLSLTKV